MPVRKFPRRVLPILLAATLTLAACNVGATPAPTMDVSAINTAALATAMAQISGQQTQTALAAPSATLMPTNTSTSLTTLSLPTNSGAASPTVNPLATISFNSTSAPGLTPFATALPPTSGVRPTTAAGCSDGVMVGETLEDKSEVEAGEYFTKAWVMKNTGTCDWDEGYVFAFLPDISSSEIKGYDIVINGSDRLIKPNRDESFVIKLLAPSTPGEYKGYWKMRDDAGNYFGSQVWLWIIVK